MADNLTLNSGSGGSTLSTDEVTRATVVQHVQYVKLMNGTDAAIDVIPGDATNGLDVDVTRVSGNVSVVGPAADGAAVSGNPVRIAGSDGTNTQDISTTTSGHVHIHDGGNSITVDGTVGVSGTVTVDSELTTADLDTGAGTDTRAVVGLVMAASGGGVLAPGDATNGLDVDVTRVSGNVTVVNGGTFATQVDGAALTALQLIDDPVFADDAAFTIGTSKVMMAGATVDETSTDSADEGDAVALRSTPDRKLIVNPQPHTAGGLSIFRSLDLDETEEDVKTSPGQVYGWAVTNTATATRWIKFYNATAATVVVGTTTPVITWGVPGNSSDDVAANVLGAHGIAFDTAICVAATTGVADADTGAPGANDVVINVFFK